MAFVQQNEILGSLDIEKSSDSQADIFFVSKDKSLGRKLLISIIGENLIMYPIDTRISLEQKYTKIKSITLLDFVKDFPNDEDDVQEMLSGLPSGFIYNFNYGLGLIKRCQIVIETIESLTNCENFTISRNISKTICDNGKTFSISYKDFEEVIKSINRTHSRGNTAKKSVISANMSNFFAGKIGKEGEPLKFGRNSERRLITEMCDNEDYIDINSLKSLFNIISSNTEKIAEEMPESVSKLRNNINFVSLDNLINEYEGMMGKKLKEKAWQNFFNANPFVFNLFFGYPVIKLGSEMAVGGKTFSRKGENITDFLIKNKYTGNVGLVEIKKPDTSILNKTPTREGVYAPSSDFSGAISQILNQKYTLQKDFTAMKGNATVKDGVEIQDIRSYAIDCCLIIGMTPKEEEQKKSFEIFRKNSKDVLIITFDELLEKFKILYEFLQLDDLVNSSDAS